MNFFVRALSSTAVAAVLGSSVLVAAPAQADDPVTINLIGINDFHGRVDPDTLKWAKVVEDLKADGGAENSLLVSAGDNVGASVFASALQDDEPTIDILNEIGLDATAAGNHEFDQGYADLVDRIVPAADFTILGANVRKADGSRALPAYDIFTVAGAKVAVIGAVTQETPTLVAPDRVDGLTFGDPSDSINEAVAELAQLPADQRPDVMVASFHEGAPDGSRTLTEAMAQSGVFNRLVDNTSPEVDAILMGHTHQKYVYDAPIPGTDRTRPIIQTGQYGENVGQVKLSVDIDTDEVRTVSARTVARGTQTDAQVITAHPQLQPVKDIRDAAVAYANKVGNVAKGEVTDDITRAYVDPAASPRVEDRASESALGNLVADALLYRIKDTAAGADLGIVNPGGLRADLQYAGVPGDPVNTDGIVTRAELNTVLPFANNLNSVRLKGADIEQVLEQQWQTNPGGPTPSRPYLQLGLSKNVTYTYDATRPAGERILAVRINGEALDPAKEYKVATFSFLAAGGDNFRAFKNGVNTDTALVDRDGWEQFFADNSPVSPSYVKHAVQTTGLKSTYRVGGTVTYTLSKLKLGSLGGPVDRSVSSKLVYGDGQSRTLASRPVVDDSATISFTLPADASGAVRVESTVFPTGTKIVVPLDVSGATVAAQPVSAVFGDDVEIDIAVSGPEETPTGDVSVKDGDTVVGQATLSGGAAKVTVDTEKIGAGVSDLTLAYAGDASYPASTGQVAVTVTRAATTATATEPTPTKVDEPAGVDVTVASATGTTPTGTVTIVDGDDVLARGDLDGGSTSLAADVSGLSVGQHTLDVVYAGDDDHQGSTSTVEVDVVKGTTPLVATSGGAAYGTSAKIRVTSDPGATGLLYLANGDEQVGVGFLQNGAANITLDKTALKPGRYTIDVYYGGSGSFDAAETSVDLTITKAATAIKKISVSPTKIVKLRTKPYVSLAVSAAGFTVDGGKVTVRASGKNYTGTVKGGKVKVRLGTFSSSGKAKLVVATFAGNALASASTTTFTVKVVSK